MRYVGMSKFVRYYVFATKGTMIALGIKSLILVFNDSFMFLHSS